MLYSTTISEEMPSMKPLLLLMLVVLGLLGFAEIEARYVPGMPNICMKPPPFSEGMCTIEIEGFYYDAATLDCQMYSIGACRLTPGQSFGSLEDCVATCVLGKRRSPDYYRNE